MFFFGLVLVAIAFLWLVVAATLSFGRRRFFGLTILALIVGLITGFEVAWRWYAPTLLRTINGRIQSIESEQALAAVVSYSALTKLERGKESEAKDQLADQVASYYWQLKEAPRLSDYGKKMLSTIEEGAANFETLKKKLQEPKPRR